MQISEALRVNRRLQHLTLFHNMVGTKGASFLSSSLLALPPPSSSSSSSSSSTSSSFSFSVSSASSYSGSVPNDCLLSLDLSCNLVSNRNILQQIEFKLRENNAYFNATEEERYAHFSTNTITFFYYYLLFLFFVLYINVLYFSGV